MAATAAATTTPTTAWNELRAGLPRLQFGMSGIGNIAAGLQFGMSGNGNIGNGLLFGMSGKGNIGNLKPARRMGTAKFPTPIRGGVAEGRGGV